MFRCFRRPKRQLFCLPDDLWTEIFLFATGNMRQWSLLQRVSHEFRRLARTRRALSRTVCNLKPPFDTTIPFDLVSVVGCWTLQLDLLSKFTAVHTLYMDHDLRNCEPLTKLASLRTLCLWNSTNLDQLFQDAQFRGLRHLSVNSPHVTDLTVELLLKFEHLTTLEMEAPIITEIGLQCLANLPNLRALKLSSCHTIADLRALAKLNLEELDLTDCGLVENWACLSSLHTLRKLDLSLNEISDKDLTGLCTLHVLRQLNLFGCQCLTDGCAASLFLFANLKHVNLHCCYRISRPVLEECKARFPCSQERFAM